MPESDRLKPVPEIVTRIPVDPVFGVAIIAGPVTTLTWPDAVSPCPLLPKTVIVYRPALPVGVVNPPDISPELTVHVSGVNVPGRPG